MNTRLLRVEAAFVASTRNRTALMRASTASCYHCLHSYSIPLSAFKWTDEGQTAICPLCGIDAVLPGKFSQEELATMHKYWFATPPMPPI